MKCLRGGQRRLAEQPQRDKSYSFDAFGKRIGLDDKRPDGRARTSRRHGRPRSISLLLNETGKAQAAYGYTAYGDSDTELNEERDRGTRAAHGLTPDNPLNP